MRNKEIKELIRQQGSLAQQLHQIRSSKQLSMERVCAETGVPMYILDNLELGRGGINMGAVYALAKYYGKKVQILLQD